MTLSLDGLCDEPSKQQWRRAIDCYAQSLPTGTLQTFPLSGLDRTGVPCWAVTFTTTGGEQHDGIGYGVCDEEALCGAHGELAETCAIGSALELVEAVDAQSTSQMRARFGRDTVVDPRALCLTPGNNFSLDRPLDWIAVTRWPDGERRWIPREFAAYDDSVLRNCPPLITPITNGLGAGPSLEHAVEHAVFELLQRDGNCTSFRAMDRGILIELDQIINPSLRRLVDDVSAMGIDIYPKLASTEFDLCNVYVVGHERDREPAFALQSTACGEACHVDREMAVRKAILEFLAARARKTFMHGPLDRVAGVAPPGYVQDYQREFRIESQEPRALQSMIRWIDADAMTLRKMLSSTIFSVRETVKLSTLPTKPAGMRPEDAAARLEVVRERLAERGIEVLVFDMTTPRHLEHGIHVARVVAPGLECETMSYGRIGVRGIQRSLDQDHPFVSLTRRGDDWLPACLPDGAAGDGLREARVNLNRIDEIVGEVYPLYREPASHAVQIALLAETPIAETPIAETSVAETSVAETSAARAAVAGSPVSGASIGITSIGDASAGDSNQ